MLLIEQLLSNYLNLSPLRSADAAAKSIVPIVEPTLDFEVSATFAHQLAQLRLQESVFDGHLTRGDLKPTKVLDLLVGLFKPDLVLL
jgi:hypothetical protein